MDRTADYLLLKTWDGVPPTAEQLETAAQFGAKARQSGPVMVHCAHGRGRSTTVMCAVLVRAGLATSWQDAFEMCQVSPEPHLVLRIRLIRHRWNDSARPPAWPKPKPRPAVHCCSGEGCPLSLKSQTPHPSNWALRAHQQHRKTSENAQKII